MIDQLALDILQHFVSDYGTSVQQLAASTGAQVVMPKAVHSASMWTAKKFDLLAHGVRINCTGNEKWLSRRDIRKSKPAFRKMG